MATKLKLDTQGQLKAETKLDNGMTKTNLNPIDTIKTQNPGVKVYNQGDSISITGQDTSTKLPGSSGMVKSSFNKTVNIPVATSNSSSNAQGIVNKNANNSIDTNKIVSPTITGVNNGTTNGATSGTTNNSTSNKGTINSDGTYSDGSRPSGATSYNPDGTVYSYGNEVVGNKGIPTGTTFDAQSNEIRGEKLTYLDDKGQTQNTSIGEILDALPEEYKSYFDELAKKGKEEWTKGLKDVLQNVGQVKSNIQYYNEQNARKQEQTGYQSEIQDIQIAAENRKAYNDLQKLKQNLNFLGYGLGQPGVSDQRITAVQNQIKEGEQTYNDIVRINELIKQSREKGIEIDEASFRKQITELENGLKNGVDKVIQQAMNDFNGYEIQGILDDPEKFDSISKQILKSMDASISGLAQTAFEQKKFVLDSFNDLANQKRQYITNSKTYQIDPIKNIYVDGNGNPVLNEFGQQIKVPQAEEKPIETFTSKDGKDFFAIYKNPDGTLRTEKQTLYEAGKFDDNIINGYVKGIVDGKIDINDLIGNVNEEMLGKIMAQYGQYSNNQGTQSNVGINNGAIDMSTNNTLINKYPNEAAFKNNNPTGITWGVSNELKQLWDNAGVKYTMGTARPKAEGGNYVKFATVEDGMKAYAVALTQRGDDIYDRLVKWVGTSNGPNYATDLMNKAGIKKGEKFSSLDENRLEKLMEEQLKVESPNFYKELTSGGLQQSQNFSSFQEKTLKEFDGKDIAKLSKNLGVSEQRARDIYNSYLNENSGDKTISDVDYENKFFATIPTQLMNSEKEFERYKVRMDAYRKSGKTAQEAADSVMGWQITKPDQTTNAIRNLLNLIENPDKTLPSRVAQMINKGDKLNAIKTVENAIMNSNKIKSDVNEYDITTAIKRANEIISLVKNNPKVFGILNGNIEQIKKKFEGNEEVQTLLTKFAQANSGLRHSLLGAAITPGEAKMTEDLFPQLTDASQNAITKLTELKKDSVKKYNNYRAQLGLPKMTEDVYLNSKNKIALYSYNGDIDKYIEARTKQLEKGTNTKKLSSGETYTW